MNLTHHLIRFSLLLGLLAMGGCTAQNKTMTTELDLIQDTYWMLISLEGEDVQGPMDTRTAYIRFEEGKDKVKGFTGCNDFFGTYEQNGEDLKLTNLSSSRMMCTAMDQENKLMNILKRVDNYSISDYLLTLYEGDTAIATFKAGNDQGMNEIEQ